MWLGPTFTLLLLKCELRRWGNMVRSRVPGPHTGPAAHQSRDHVGKWVWEEGHNSGQWSASPQCCLVIWDSAFSVAESSSSHRRVKHEILDNLFSLIGL